MISAAAIPPCSMEKHPSHPLRANRDLKPFCVRIRWKFSALPSAFKNSMNDALESCCKAADKPAGALNLSLGEIQLS
jgi:hypothetical protein